MSWDDADFASDDPLVRYNAHQAAKGRPGLPDPDLLRKREREVLQNTGVCQRCGMYVDMRLSAICKCGGVVL